MVSRNGSRPTFFEMLRRKWDEGKFVCVGLDSEVGKIPDCVKNQFTRYTPKKAMASFNWYIVNATKDVVCAYKLNLAFYIAHGDRDLLALRDTVQCIRTFAPDVPVILDAKDMDIGNTNIGYVQMAFEYCNADAITVNPYLGMEAAQPFLDEKDKGIIVLCKTSNSGSGEFQDRDVSGDTVPGGYMPLYQYVAYRVSQFWNKNRNCMLVVGATYPNQLREIRELVGNMPILIPGIGAQGGDVEATVKAGMDSNGQGMIINSSRGIIFASNGSDFAEVARCETLALHNLINQYRN